jgi:hypothetical protein
MSTHNAVPRPATVGSSANVRPRKSLGYFLGGATALAVLLGSAGSAFAKGPRACNAYASGDTASIADVKKTLDDSKLFDSVTNIDVSSTPPSAATFAMCDSVIVWSDTSRSFNYPTEIGDALAAFVEQGGGVVVVNPYYASLTYSNVYSANWDKYMLMERGSMTSTSKTTLGTKDMLHPVMAGIGKVETNGSRCYQRSSATGSAIRSIAKPIASWTDGNAMMLYGTPNGRPRIDLNMVPVSSTVPTYGCYDPASDAGRLIAQAVFFVASPVKVTPSPLDFGEVPVGLSSIPLTAELENTSSNSVTLISGDLAPTGIFNVSGVTFPVTLKPGEKVTLSATARPAVAGVQNATFSMTQTTMGAAPIVLSMSVRGLGPRFDVQPQVIDFGGVPVGTTPANVLVTVTNTGGGYLQLNPTPTINDTTNFGLEKLPMGLPTLLGPMGSATFEVKFTPTAETVYNTLLRIPYTINGSTTNGTVNVKGSFGKPKIQVPGSLVMTPVRVGQPGPEQSILVTNIGNADLSITGLTFTGTDAAEFKAISVASTMTPIKVTPSGGTYDLRVQCNPMMSGLRQGILSIQSDDPMTPTANIALSCKGTVANFKMDPDKLDYTPAQQTGSCSAPKNVTITNSGTDSLRVLTIGFTGTNAASFKHSAGTGIKLVPPNNGTLKIPVSFCPVDIGAQTASLALTTDLTMGHAASVPLTGTAQGPKVVVTPGNINFGAVYIKTTSMSQKITITNDGDQPLVFGKNSVTPAMPGGVFKVTGLPADGKTLNKGDAPIVLDVSASPLMAMQQTGEITIFVNDQVKMGVLRIPLSVTGTQADIAVAPMMMTFPVTIIGTKSMEQTLTVTNSGAAPLTGLNLSIAGTAASDFGFAGNIPMSIDSGMSATFKVYFKPTGNGTRTGIFVVNAAGLATPAQVKLEGTGKLLTISCSPDDKNLGTVAVGSSVPLKIVCRNSDTSMIEYIASFSENLDDWTVDPAMGTIPAGSIADEGLVSLNVTFKPTGTGPRTTTLTIKTKDGIAVGSVNLDGTGLPTPKMRTDEMTGCAYGGTPRSPAPLWLLGLAAACFLVIRRRRFSA